MSLWTLQQPPNWFANSSRTPAVATPSGWQDPITGELLVAITGLSTTKEPNGAPTLVRVTFDKISYKHGDTAYVIAQYNEAVTVTGTPQVAISVNGSPHTLSYVSGSTTSFLKFSYTVGNSDVATAGQLSITSPLSLNSGTILGSTNKALTVTSITGTFPVGSTVVGGSSGTTGVVSYFDSVNSIIYVNTVTGTGFSGSETVNVIGSGATAGTPVLVGGKIRSIPVTAGGTLYSVPPTVTITDSTGSGATAHAVLTRRVVQSASPDVSPVTLGAITSIIVDNNGSNYTSPSVSIAVQGVSTLSSVAGPAAPLAFSADPSVALAVMDAVLPTISSVTVPAGSYTTGMTIPITVTFSKAVAITGTPTATVNFSDSSTTGTATCQTDPGSQFAGANGLSTTAIFNYVVQKADLANEGNFSISSPILTPNSATIKDQVGNSATLTHSETFSYVGVNDVGLISGVVLAPNSNGSLDFQTGDTMNFVVALDQPVVVTGSPYLAFDIHSTTRNATYNSGSGTKSLVFTYTPVVTGDVATQSQLVTHSSTSSITLNGGTINDLAGTAADLNYSQVSFTTATVNSAYVTNVTGAPSAGNYVTGAVLSLTAHFNENVTVATAVPYITVTIGSNPRHFTYVSGSTTSALLFQYTLVGGDAAVAGGFTVGTSITLNGATIQNGDSQNAVLTFTAPSTPNVVVNDPAPTVSSVAVAANNYPTGSTIPVVVTFNTAVYVTGVPTIAITTTGGTYTINYASGTGTTALTFNYIVQTTDTVGAVSSASTTLGLPGIAAIVDATGKAFTNSFSAGGTFSNVVTNDVQARLGTPVVSSTGVGTFPVLAYSDVFVLTFTASKALTVTGSPYVAVTFNGTTRHAVYASGTGTTTLVFNYTTVLGDVSAAGQVSVAPTAVLSGGTMLDSNGGPAVLGFISPNVTTVQVINDTAATIATPAIAPGNYVTSAVIPVTVTFGAAVFVTGTPTLAITTTGGTRSVNYASGSGTTILTFNYTVVSGDTIGAVSSAATSLGLSGATIKDQYGVTATNSFTAASTFTGVATNDVLATLGTPVVTNPTNATYPLFTHPDVFTMTFTASKAITVTGAPYVAVTTAGGVRHAAYASGTGTTTLVFSYATVLGDAGIAGTVTTAASVTLNSGTLKDSLGIPATLTFSAPDVSLVHIA